MIKYPQVIDALETRKIQTFLRMGMIPSLRYEAIWVGLASLPTEAINSRFFSIIQDKVMFCVHPSFRDYEVAS